MRLALLSDIHGNPLALDAILADIRATCGGADTYWVLGDLVAIGYDPAGVLERLVALPNVSYTYGNTDRYLLTYSQTDRYLITGPQPFVPLAEIQAQPHTLATALVPGRMVTWSRQDG
jgi:predicted phosphodiesterase